MAEKKVRKWQPREFRLLAEYMAKFFPDISYKQRVRLGAPQPRLAGKFTQEEMRAFQVFNRWADAIAFLPTKELLIIEAKIRPEPGAVAQLLLYESLVPHTPDLHQYISWPIKMRIIYAISDPATFMLARRFNIEVVAFTPPWIAEYLDLLFPREKTPHKF